MKAEQVMNRAVVTCFDSDSLENAAAAMWDSDLGCLPVIDADGRVTGMLTDRDIAMAAFLKGRPLREIRVESVAHRVVQGCLPDATIGEIERLMQRAQVRRVPVVDERGVLLGLISLSDLTRQNVASSEEIAQTLSAITERRRPEAWERPVP